MSTMPAGSRVLLLIGIAINLVVLFLNHAVGLAVNHGDYIPFAVVPQVSAQIYDETQLYALGPSRFFRTGQVQAELDVFELRDVPNSYPVLHSILLGLINFPGLRPRPVKIDNTMPNLGEAHLRKAGVMFTNLELHRSLAHLEHTLIHELIHFELF